MLHVDGLVLLSLRQFVVASEFLFPRLQPDLVFLLDLLGSYLALGLQLVQPDVDGLPRSLLAG